MVGYKDTSDVAKEAAEVAQKRAITGPWWVLFVIEVW